MADIALLAIGAIVVNNFVLTQFLGLCPFVGASRHTTDAISMGLATAFVLTLAAGAGHLIHHHVLVPLDLEYLRIVCFMVIIASLVQFTEIAIRYVSPLLHQVL
jgi:electron transport complex protein RnfA